jgi:hypothetical protein
VFGSRPITVAVAILTLAVLGAGCGNHRQRVPDVTGSPKPAKATQLDYPGAGVSFTAPRNWYQGGGPEPLVVALASGRAGVAVWRYPRKEPIPKTKSELEQAQANLSDAVQGRDRSVHIENTRVVDVNGAKGIQVVATERIAGQPRRVRSTHFFDRRAENVFDAYAPPADFARLDGSVFQPLIQSVRLRAPNSPRA